MHWIRGPPGRLCQHVAGCHNKHAQHNVGGSIERGQYNQLAVRSGRPPRGDLADCRRLPASIRRV